MNKKVFFRVFGTTTVCLICFIVAVSFLTSFFGGSGKNLTKLLDKKSAEERHNVLVLGTDKDGTRSDVIMIFSISSKDNTVNVLSVPRDTRIKIDGNYQKINSAIGAGGDELAVETVKKVTGIEVHDYVKVNFDAVADVIDALGGVTFNVPQDMDYEDPYQDLFIHLKQGEQKLKGDKALQLLRFRRYPMGDLQRISVQQDFIKEIVKQKAKLRYIFKVKKIYQIAKKNMTTTLSASDLTKLCFGLFGIKTENVKTYECPYHFSQSGIYVIINEDELSEIVQQHFK